MKSKFIFVAALMVFASACSRPAGNTPTASRTPTPLPSISPAAVQPAATSPPIKDGDYKGEGTVTKIEPQRSSVEMDHGDIPGLMPPMRMEFYVSDQKMLEGLKIGDKVAFTIRYKAGSEMIVDLRKEK